jgi:DNA-binding response OmpR family regulator
MRVLLVDDEVDLASALAERLDLRGIEADWATSAQQALEMAAVKEYDLSVLDIKMPGIGGVELRQELNALYPQMKFVFLTGYGSEEDFKTVTGCVGDECYLVKPVDISELIIRMHQLLKGKGGDT